MKPLVRAALRARAHPLGRRVERVIRRFPPVDRLARRGYDAYKRARLAGAVTDPALRRALREGAPLPEGFGRGMDERIVEYPWVFAHLPDAARRILDAGSTLNHAWVAGLPALRDRDVVLYTLAPEGTLGRRGFSYVYGDLRDTVLRDRAFDAVVCISTLEHVGMDNRAYTGRASDVERDRKAYRAVLQELARVMRPGAPLLLTVPFGAPADLGWLQVFGPDELDDIVRWFGGEARRREVYRHDTRAGWRRADEAASADAVYLEKRRHGATMAEAIACLELIRG